MMLVSFSSKTTDVTSGAETEYPTRAFQFIPRLCMYRVVQTNFLCSVVWIIVCPFVFGHCSVCLFVFGHCSICYLWITASVYPFGILWSL
jgi:hypothetical protein